MQEGGATVLQRCDDAFDFFENRGKVILMKPKFGDMSTVDMNHADQNFIQTFIYECIANDLWDCIVRKCTKGLHW